MTEPQFDEVSLVSRAQAGDATAFEELVRHYHGRCFRVAMRMLGNAHDANDAVQESFLSAWQALGRFRSGQSFAPWLVTIVSHRCLNALRSRRRSRLEPLDELRVAGGTESDPALAWERQENASQLDAVMRQLPPGPLAIVVLHYTEGLGCQAIGEMLGMSESAVKVALFRARARLRDMLGGKDKDAL